MRACSSARRRASRSSSFALRASLSWTKHSTIGFPSSTSANWRPERGDEGRVLVELAPVPACRGRGRGPPRPPGTAAGQATARSLIPGTGPPIDAETVPAPAARRAPPRPCPPGRTSCRRRRCASPPDLLAERARSTIFSTRRFVARWSCGTSGESDDFDLHAPAGRFGLDLVLVPDLVVAERDDVGLDVDDRLVDVRGGAEERPVHRA